MITTFEKLLILPQANAYVERLFSNLADIMMDKQNMLPALTIISGMAVIRAFLRFHNISMPPH